MGLNVILDFVLGPFIKLNPFFGLVIISFVLTLVVTLIYKYATNQEVLKSLKEETKALRDEMKKFTDDPKRLMELQKKVFEKSFEPFKHNIKPMLITMLPFVLIFYWLRGTFNELGNPKLLLGIGWFWTYLIFSIIFSTILRKFLKVH